MVKIEKQIPQKIKHTYANWSNQSSLWPDQKKDFLEFEALEHIEYMCHNNCWYTTAEN